MRRALWMLPGMAVGAIGTLVVRALLGTKLAGHPHLISCVDALPLLGGILSLWIAARKGKVPMEELTRPATLVGDRPKQG